MTNENSKRIIQIEGWSDDGTTPVVRIVEVKDKDDDEVHKVLEERPWKPEDEGKGTKNTPQA